MPHWTRDAAPPPAAPSIDRERIKAQIEEIMGELESLKELVAMDATALQALAQSAQEEYLRLRNLADRWSSLKKARDTASEMAIESETYKGMKKELEGIVAGLLKRVADTFVARVQAYLPGDWKFGLQLVDGDKEVFRLGLMAGKKLRAALSGAEWATVTCALAMAISTNAGADQPVLVMPEDRGWDAGTLANVLAAWGAFTGQVVIGTTTKPKKVPTGWTVIDLSKAEVEAVPEVVVPEAPTMKLFIPSASMRAMLQALGYTDGQISKLDREKAAHIIANGIVSEVK